MAAEKRLITYIDGALAGEFSMSPGGSVTFRYDEGYAADPNSVPVSLSLPTEGLVHRNKPSRAFLDGLIPEDEDEKRRIQELNQLRSTDAFALLSATGRDAAGAVQLLPPDADPSDACGSRDLVQLISDSDFASMIEDLAVGSGRAAREIGGRFSLAGAQRKVALHRTNGSWAKPLEATPTTHIIKPAIAGLDDHDVAEAMSMWAADFFDIPVAQTELGVTTQGRSVLISRRYDRVKQADGWHRIHQEDFCQALSVEPSKKYQEDSGGPGVGEISRLLRRMSPSEQQARSSREFFRALVFNVIALCTDAHAKNYSIVHLPGGVSTLAPLYDLATHAPYPSTSPLRSAMKVGDHYRLNSISTKDFVREGARLGLGEDESVEIVDTTRRDIVASFESAALRIPAGNKEFSKAANRIVASIEASAREHGSV
jgi:serine/threonine-protein kinase HipA